MRIGDSIKNLLCIPAPGEAAARQQTVTSYQCAVLKLKPYSRGAAAPVAPVIAARGAQRATPANSRAHQLRQAFRRAASGTAAPQACKPMLDLPAGSIDDLLKSFKADLISHAGPDGPDASRVHYDYAGQLHLSPDEVARIVAGAPDREASAAAPPDRTRLDGLLRSIRTGMEELVLRDHDLNGGIARELRIPYHFKGPLTLTEADQLAPLPGTRRDCLAAIPAQPADIALSVIHAVTAATPDSEEQDGRISRMSRHYEEQECTMSFDAESAHASSPGSTLQRPTTRDADSGSRAPHPGHDNPAFDAQAESPRTSIFHPGDEAIYAEIAPRAATVDTPVAAGRKQGARGSTWRRILSGLGLTSGKADAPAQPLRSSVKLQQQQPRQSRPIPVPRTRLGQQHMALNARLAEGGAATRQKHDASTSTDDSHASTAETPMPSHSPTSWNSSRISAASTPLPMESETVFRHDRTVVSRDSAGATTTEVTHYERKTRSSIHDEYLVSANKGAAPSAPSTAPAATPTAPRSRAGSAGSGERGEWNTVIRDLAQAQRVETPQARDALHASRAPEDSEAQAGPHPHPDSSTAPDKPERMNVPRKVVAFEQMERALRMPPPIPLERGPSRLFVPAEMRASAQSPDALSETVSARGPATQAADADGPERARGSWTTAEAGSLATVQDTIVPPPLTGMKKWLKNPAVWDRKPGADGLPDHSMSGNGAASLSVPAPVPVSDTVPASAPVPAPRQGRKSWAEDADDDARAQAMSAAASNPPPMQAVRPMSVGAELTPPDRISRLAPRVDPVLDQLMHMPTEELERNVDAIGRLEQLMLDRAASSRARGAARTDAYQGISPTQAGSAADAASTLATLQERRTSAHGGGGLDARLAADLDVTQASEELFFGTPGLSNARSLDTIPETISLADSLDEPEDATSIGNMSEDKHVHWAERLGLPLSPVTTGRAGSKKPITHKMKRVAVSDLPSPDSSPDASPRSSSRMDLPWVPKLGTPV